VSTRTTCVGFSFSTPYYYVGLGFAGTLPFGGCADQLNATDECQGMKVCVLDGTTHVELLPFANVLLSQNDDAYYATFADSLCNVLAGEPAGISEVKLL
jgi:ABC-type amino acid transport substrate-binding protein